MPELFSENVLSSPSPQLRGAVGRYDGFRYSGATRGTHHGLPSRYLTLVISCGPPIEFVDVADNAVPPGSYQAVVGGMHSRPAVMRDHGEGFGVIAALSPLAARRLLGMPAGALAGHVVDLAELWGPAARELTERVSEAESWTARFEAVDDVMARVLRDRAEPPSEVSRAWQQLVRSGGTLPVARVADDVGWSRRHLVDRFHCEIGLGVKEAARVLRFERASAMIEHQVSADLAAVAAACGYYDQAHMANEWQSIAGMPISEWLAQELRDPPLDPVAF